VVCFKIIILISLYHWCYIKTCSVSERLICHHLIVVFHGGQIPTFVR